MLSEHQLASFREQLETEQAELLKEEEALTGDLAHTDTLDQESDWSDTSLQVYQHQRDMASKAFFAKRLAQIDHALRRMDDGVYGISEVSGRPIPVERLDANPAATTLVNEPPHQL